MKSRGRLADTWVLIDEHCSGPISTDTYALESSVGLLVRTVTRCGEHQIHVNLCHMPNAALWLIEDHWYIRSKLSGAGVSPAGNY